MPAARIIHTLDTVRLAIDNARIRAETTGNKELEAICAAVDELTIAVECLHHDLTTIKRATLRNQANTPT